MYGYDFAFWLNFLRYKENHNRNKKFTNNNYKLESTQYSSVLLKTTAI